MPPEIKVESLLNYSQASLLLHVTRATIYAMIRRGELHPVAIADRRYLNKEEVEGLRNEKAPGHPGALSPSQGGQTD